MEITTEQYTKIIRFLDAEMEPDEMDDFEKELNSNPEMRYQLNFEQSVRDSLSLQNITSLTHNTTERSIPETRKISGKVSTMLKWLSAAAIVIIALTLFTPLFQKTKNTTTLVKTKDIDTQLKINKQPPTTVTAPVNNDDKAVDLDLLFKQYFKKDTLPKEYPIFLAEALTDYESGKYTTLHQLNLNELPQTRGSGETDVEANILALGHYYKGLAFLQTNNTRQAIIHLDWVLNKQAGYALKNKTQWYLALAYLKENNAEKAAQLCRTIIKNNEDEVLVKKAHALLSALKN